MLKSKFSAFILYSAIMSVSGAAVAAEGPGAFAAADLARRLYVPESKIAVAGAEKGSGGTSIVTLEVEQGKSGKATMRYTLRPAAGGAIQVARVDYPNGAHDEYVYSGDRLTAVKEYGRQGKLLHDAAYERDAKTGRDRLAKVVHHDWSKPQLGFVRSTDLYRYDASGALKTVERFPNETNTRPENRFVAFSYEGAPGLERIVKSVDSRGMGTDYVYAPDGTLARTSAQDLTVTEYVRNASGRDAVARTTDYRGMGTEYSYDKRGELVKTVAADGTVTEYTTIADMPLPLRTTDVRGRVTQYAYDASGVPLKTTVHAASGAKIDEVTSRLQTAGGDPGFLRSSTTSDGFSYTYRSVRFTDSVETATDPRGRVRVYEYDDFVRPSRVTHKGAGTGYVDEYEYSGKGPGVTAVVKRYAAAGGEKGPLVGTLKTGAQERLPERFDFAGGETLRYRDGLAHELRSKSGDVLLTFKNEVDKKGQLLGYSALDASGAAVGAYEYYDDPADVAASYLRGRA